MRELKTYELSQAYGGFNDIFMATLPTTLMAIAGLGHCYERGLSYFAPLPAIATVAIFSIVGAIAAQYDHRDPAYGAELGGCIGIVVSMAFGIDKLA